MCDSVPSSTSSPRAQCTPTLIKLPIVPLRAHSHASELRQSNHEATYLGTNSAASLPNMSAALRWRLFTVGSATQSYQPVHLYKQAYDKDGFSHVALIEQLCPPTSNQTYSFETMLWGATRFDPQMTHAVTDYNVMMLAAVTPKYCARQLQSNK